MLIWITELDLWNMFVVLVPSGVSLMAYCVVQTLRYNHAPVLSSEMLVFTD